MRPRRPMKPSSTSASDTRRTVWPNSVATSSAVSVSMHVVDLQHHALTHQELDDLDAADGHPVGQLLHGDDVGDDDFAGDAGLFGGRRPCAFPSRVRGPGEPRPASACARRSPRRRRRPGWSGGLRGACGAPLVRRDGLAGRAGALVAAAVVVVVVGTAVEVGAAGTRGLAGGALDFGRGRRRGRTQRRRRAAARAAGTRGVARARGTRGAGPNSGRSRRRGRGAIAAAAASRARRPPPSRGGVGAARRRRARARGRSRPIGGGAAGRGRRARVVARRARRCGRPGVRPCAVACAALATGGRGGRGAARRGRRRGAARRGAAAGAARRRGGGGGRRGGGRGRRRGGGGRSRRGGGCGGGAAARPRRRRRCGGGGLGARLRRPGGASAAAARAAARRRAGGRRAPRRDRPPAGGGRRGGARTRARPGAAACAARVSAADGAARLPAGARCARPLGLDHHRLGPAVAEALLHRARADRAAGRGFRVRGARPARAGRFRCRRRSCARFTPAPAETVAHRSFQYAKGRAAIARPARLKAPRANSQEGADGSRPVARTSVVQRSAPRPARKAVCITFSPPKAKPNSSDVKTPNRPGGLGGACGPALQHLAPAVGGAVGGLDQPGGLAGGDRGGDLLEAGDKVARRAAQGPGRPAAAVSAGVSTWSARSGGGGELGLGGAGEQALLAPPSRPPARSAATHMPRPGSLRARSGTTAPSGPATKRISRASSMTSPETMSRALARRPGRGSRAPLGQARAALSTSSAAASSSAASHARR